MLRVSIESLFKKWLDANVRSVKGGEDCREEIKDILKEIEEYKNSKPKHEYKNELSEFLSEFRRKWEEDGQ